MCVGALSEEESDPYNYNNTNASENIKNHLELTYVCRVRLISYIHKSQKPCRVLMIKLTITHLREAIRYQPKRCEELNAQANKSFFTTI